MEVTVYPVGRAPFPVRPTRPPKYSEVDPGGYDKATIPCALTPEQAERALDAYVEIVGPTGPVWAGWVWDYTYNQLVCAGPISRLGIVPETHNGGGGPSYSDKTTTYIINDAVAEMTTTDLPTAYRTLFVGTESTSISFSLAASTYASEIIKEALKYVAWRFGFWHRQVDNVGTLYPVPVYEAAPATPAYQVQVDRPLNGRTMDGLYSAVRVTYNNGASTTDVQDTDPSHYLVQIGRRKWGMLDVKTTVLGQAQAAAAVFLAEKGRCGLSGRLSVQGGQVLSANGIPVPPCSLRAGELVRVIGNDGGSRTARLMGVEKEGASKAELYLDESPNTSVLIQRIAGV